METMTTEMELPDGWRKGKIGDISSIRYGKAKPSDDGEIPVIGSSGIYSTTANALIDFPTIVVGRKGSAGKAWLQESPCWPSDTAFYLEWKKEPADLYFVYYSIIANPLSGKNAQTTMPSIQKSELEDFSFTLPPLPEQRAIANVLGAVQAALAARRREQHLEQEHKAALLEQLFTRGTRGEATRETAIGPVPVGWEVVKLGDVALTAQYGLSKRGETNGQYPILRMNCLIQGQVSMHGLQYVDLSEKEFRQFSIQPGDILFNRTNSAELVGKSGIVSSEQEAVFASYLVRLTLDRSRAVPDFVNYYLNDAPTLMRLRAMASRGVSQANINASKLKTLQIPLPPLPEQERMAAVLGALDAKLGALAAEVARLEELFRALLEELLSGRRRVEN